MIDIMFAKIKSNAIIPSRRSEDAGMDVYACFEDDYVMISKGEIIVIPTGIASAFDEEHMLEVCERGSTGLLGMSLRCRIVDSGYRGEMKIAINNTSNRTIIIAKKNKIEDIKLKLRIGIGVGVDDSEFHKIDETLGEKFTFYPYEKAIAQVVLVPVPRTNIIELTYDELLKIESKRGVGMDGSSGK